MGKLKFLKNRIKEWNASNMHCLKNVKAQHKKELETVDAKIDEGKGDEEDIRNRMEIINSLKRYNKLESAEIAQKAKIKWAVEGDENSRFFHGMLNKRRNTLNIRGVLVDGVWMDSPNKVKSEFLDHFKKRFCTPGKRGASLLIDFPKQLNVDQQKDLECEVSNEEIKREVWECGTDKAPGPDGFTFGFFRHFWNLIDKDAYEAVRYFFNHNDIPIGCNSSFIALIPKIPDANLVKDLRPISLIGSLYKIIAKVLTNRLVGVLGDIINEVQSAFIADKQILDGPFILNEVLKWCMVKKKQALIFKVDFEKAYDSVRWDFLDDVLYKFGFGDKWRKWIQCCLRSVNGSPTEEFQFGRGLKQGDPLSPFLFILIMESLHLSFQRVIDAGMFQAIKLDASVNLSHMFYADDAVFVGYWNDSNITTLVHVLECFFRASGLKINMGKSKIMGVNVDNAKVSRAAVKLRCLVLKAPFVYLGSIVGGNMNRLHAWNDIVDRIKRRLSKWKMTSLSIGGRLTLVKSVLGSMPIFYMAMFKVLAGVLSMLEMIRSHFLMVMIFRVRKLHGFAGKRLGDRESTVFWEDYWNEGGKLKDLFPRLYNLETSKGVTVGRKLAQPNLIYSFHRTPRGGAERVQMEELEMLINSVRLTPMADRLIWTLDSAENFLVASVRTLIDNKMLPVDNLKTRWIKNVPIKVNVYAWKVMTDSLPTRFNISRRGIDIDSLVCVNCDRGVETSRHFFFECGMVKQVSHLINHWWDVPDMEIDSYDTWKTWLSNICMHSRNKKMFEGIYYVMWWLIWNFQNKKIFEAKVISKAIFFDDVIQSVLELKPVPKYEVGKCSEQLAELFTKLGSEKLLSIRCEDKCENRASWSDKLDDALWAFRTAYKTPIGCTPYKLVMQKYGVTHRLETPYHPQTSGQMEVSNRGLKRILERVVGENRASWSDKLDDALWAFRTAYKTLIGCTPYKLVYEKACHLPVELEHKAYWALKHANFDQKTASDHRKVQINELNELRDQAYENSLIYKEKSKRLHDSKIKNRVFNIGNRVLLFNSRLKIFSGKLKSRWSGLFTISHVFPYGTVELTQSDRPNFKVNGHRLKHSIGDDIPKLVVSDLQTFANDH
nr:RNA-directed DNA polymerase, eukaryota [Tanacetum cinerariifolium]